MTARYWNQLLDDLKAKGAFRSDAKMAASLDVSRALVSAVRLGRIKFSLEVGKKIFAQLGRTMTDDDLFHFEPRNIQAARKTTVVFSSRERAFVIRRAEGRCQLCGCEAPFIGTNGIPYLEIHRIKPIEQGGTHHRDNLAAVCPNCNRRLQVLRDPADLKKLDQLDYSTR